MPDYMKTNNKSREDKSQTGRSYSNKSCQCQRHLRDVGSIPVLGGSPGEGHSNPLQSSCLEIPRDRGALWATVHRVAESDMTEAT